MGYKIDLKGPTFGSIVGYMVALAVLAVSVGAVAIAWGAPQSQPTWWQWALAAVIIAAITVGTFRLVKAFADRLISGSPD